MGDERGRVGSETGDWFEVVSLGGEKIFFVRIRNLSVARESGFLISHLTAIQPRGVGAGLLSSVRNARSWI